MTARVKFHNFGAGVLHRCGLVQQLASIQLASFSSSVPQEGPSPAVRSNEACEQISKLGWSFYLSLFKLHFQVQAGSKITSHKKYQNFQAARHSSRDLYSSKSITVKDQEDSQNKSLAFLVLNRFKTGVRKYRHISDNISGFLNYSPTHIFSILILFTKKPCTFFLHHGVTRSGNPKRNEL